jgi:hypothetical protein
MASVCFCFRGKENMAVHGIRGKIWNHEGKIWDVASLLLVWLCTPARWHFLIGWSILARPSRQPLWSAIVPHLTLLASFRFCFFSPWPTFLSPSCEYILKIHGNVAALVHGNGGFGWSYLNRAGCLRGGEVVQIFLSLTEVIWNYVIRVAIVKTVYSHMAKPIWFFMIDVWTQHTLPL